MLWFKNPLRNEPMLSTVTEVMKMTQLICHETNLEKSKQYKDTKYVNLQADWLL